MGAFPQGLKQPYSQGVLNGTAKAVPLNENWVTNDLIIVLDSELNVIQQAADVTCWR